MKRTLWPVGIPLLVAAIVFVVVAGGFPFGFLRVLYPIHYSGTIGRYASEYGLDPFLVAAVVRVESGYDPNAVSNKGAMGLMQIMPSTGRWISGRLGVTDYSDAMLSDPVLNVRMGCWYLRNLYDGFRNPTDALTAYNAGRGRVSEWKRTGKWAGGNDLVDRIPYRETRVYVRRVLGSQKFYKRIYRNEWPSD